MKFFKEFSFRFFIVLVMLSLAFVGWDLSKPVLLNESGILTEDIVECIVHPFSSAMDDPTQSIETVPSQGYNFIWNILLPLMIYLISIGGFTYLLIEDFKIIRAFSKKNKVAKVLWIIWIILLLGLTLIPLFFCIQLLMKGVILAVIATAIFLISIAFLYAVSNKKKKVKKC